MSGKVRKRSVSPETSPPNRDLGGCRLRRFMLKMSVSPETSSQNGDVEIGREIFGSLKMAVSLETSPKKMKCRRSSFRHLFGGISEYLQDGPRSEIVEKPMVFQHLCLKVSVSLETSSKNAFGRVLENVLL